MLATILWNAPLADALAERARGVSPVPWWAIGVVAAACAAAAALAWRRPAQRGRRRASVLALAGALVALALVVATRTDRGDPRDRLTTTSGAGANAPGASAPRVPRAVRLATLDNSLRAIEDGERDSPRDRWDPGYVVSRLGRDPDVLSAWVRENTSWIPYRGALRGPVGVLMDRQGGSLDRALLLTALLEKAGHTVRLAHATLGRERALELLPALVAARHARSLAVPSEFPKDLGPDIRNVAARYQLNGSALENSLGEKFTAMVRALSDLDVRVADQSTRLGTLLGPRSGRDDGPARLEAALGALGDHWWVQRQEGSAWVDLDLVAPRKTNAASRGAPDRIVEVSALDSALYHQVVVRVVAERWSAGALRERRALEHSLRPAELIGKPITLQIWPAAWPNEILPAGDAPREALRTTALAQHAWRATLSVGSVPAADVVIGDDGETRHASAGGPMGGIGRGIVGALGNPAASGGVLTAAWLEYEVRVPGEPPRTIRRAIFDLIGPAMRVSTPVTSPALDTARRLERSLALMRSTDLLPMTGALAPEFVTHLAAQGVLGNRDILRASIRGEIPGTPSALQDLAERAAPMPSPLYTVALARFGASPEADDVFLDRPNLFTRHRFLAATRSGITLRDATDIVANEVGVDLRAQDAFGVRLRQGVRDTNAEALVPPARRVFGSLAQAFAVRGEWVAATSPADPRLARLDVSQDVRQRVADDLGAGYVVVAPTAPVRLGPEQFVGWWRIDPNTGHTLGVASTGWGQTLGERAVQIGWVAAAAWAFEYLICQGALIYQGPPKGVAQHKPFFPPLVTPLYAQEGGVCAVDALVAAFLAAGFEVAAVTWPLVLRTIAGRGYSGILSGRPLIQTGEVTPGDAPPIFGNRGGSSPPASDCPQPSGRPAPLEPEGRAPNPEPGEATGENRPARPEPGEGSGQPGTPDEDWFYPNPEGGGPRPVRQDQIQKRSDEVAAELPQVERAADEAAIAHSKLAQEYDAAEAGFRSADGKYQQLKQSDPNSPETQEAYEQMLAAGRKRIEAGDKMDAARRELTKAERAAEKLRYTRAYLLRLAEANRKALAALAERDAALRDFNEAFQNDARFEGPAYDRWKRADEQYRAARRELSDAYWDSNNSRGGAYDNTEMPGTAPAGSGGSGGGGSPRPGNEAGGQCAGSPLANSIAGTAGANNAAGAKQ